MALYRWPKQGLDEVHSITFEEAGVKEETDLQDALRVHPDAIEKGLFIIAREFSNFEDSQSRVDLLALDKSGKLVVVELKRTQTGGKAELQAIRYAAMVSNIKKNQIIEARRECFDETREQAEASIREHLGLEEGDPPWEIDTERPRMIVVSAGFSKELTTSALWLRENFKLEITLVELVLYGKDADRLLHSNQIIPWRQTEDYYVKVREKREEKEQQRKQGGGSRSLGGGEFEAAIRKVDDEERREQFGKMYRWAKDLADEDLAHLVSFVGENTTLGVKVREKRASLVTFYISSRLPPVCLWNENIKNYAGKSVEPIERVLGSELKSHHLFTAFNDGLLQALARAYKEAADSLESDAPAA